MASVHLLNVSPGDCTIIRHNSGRVTMIDICDGNVNTFFTRLLALAPATPTTPATPATRFRMCSRPTNPVEYARGLGISGVFRFILTHPDMDHMDGFDALVDQIGVSNFWDTRSRRPKSNFSNGPFLEKDWDRYVRVRDGVEPGVSTGLRLAGDRFAYANLDVNGDGPDGLHILAPDASLVADPNICDDVNEGSYVILYRAEGNRILLPGDAHDASWEYVRTYYAADVANCSFLLAPHHGRDSGRSYDFLDFVRPALTLMGCAPSEHIDYGQWSRRGLEYITSNQCGNVVLETAADYVAVYVENVDFAVSRGEGGFTNAQGYAFLRVILAT